MRRALLLVLWPRVASGACTTTKEYQLGTSTGTSTSEISTAAIGKGRGREKAGNRTRRLEALWPAIAGPGKVCTPGDKVNGKFNPALNLKGNRRACQEWAVSRGRSVYVWGTNNGCQSCGTTNTRDGWGGYSVYQKGGAAAASNCRSDICTDYGSDCCAPGSELRGCSMAGYQPQADPDGTSGWGPCVSTYGQSSVYQCCSAGGSSSSKKGNDEPDSASAGFIVAILLMLLVVVLVGGIYVLYKKVLNLEAQRRPPTNPGAFFEVGAVELESTSPMGYPPKPGYVPQVHFPQTAAVEVPAAPYSPPRAQVLTVEPSAPEQGTMV